MERIKNAEANVKESREVLQGHPKALEMTAQNARGINPGYYVRCDTSGSGRVLPIGFTEHVDVKNEDKYYAPLTLEDCVVRCQNTRCSLMGIAEISANRKPFVGERI